MIEGIIIGVLSMIVLFLLIEKIKNKKKVKIEIKEEDKKKMQEMQKSFNNLMNYDYEQAVKKEV